MDQEESIAIPKEMKAIVLEDFGPPDTLQYKTVPTPQIKNDTDILVRVNYAGVNPKNAILGADFAGVIVAKGSKVTGFVIGDAVFGTLALPSGPQGSYGEYTVVNVAKDKAIAKKPDNLSFAEVAAVGIAGLTALEGVVCKRPLPLQPVNENERPKVLVVGASGGVGLYGIQIAKAVGAEVVGICSTRNTELVKQYADRVVNYDNQADMAALTENETDSYDVVFDTVGGDDYYIKLTPLVKKKAGVFSTAVGPMQHFGSTKVGVLNYLSLGASILYRRLFSSRRYDTILLLPHSRLSTVLAPWLENQIIKSHVPPDNIFDLKDAAKAHEKIESHRVVGKIVLRVNPEA